MRYRTLLLAITLSLGASTGALAQPVDAHAAAEEQFRQGREALERADYKAALGLFRKSQELEPGRGKLLNLAICEEQLGLLTEATQHFQDVLPQLAGDERLTIAQQHLTALIPRVPHVRIELAPSSPPGATVSADGAPLAPTALGAEMPYNPGKHAFTVTAPGRSERRYDLTLEEGKRAALTVEAGAVITTEAVTLPEVTPTPTSSRRTVGFIVGGVGVAGLAVGAVTGIVSLNDHASALKACPTRMGCSSDVIAQAKSGQTLSIVSTAAFAAGAVAAGVGLYLVLSGGKGPSPAAAPRAGLTVLPGGARLGFEAAF
jgi:hypothetical protein